MATAGAAQSADTLAMPVRKSGGSEVQSGDDKKSKAEAPEGETSAEKAAAKRLTSALGGLSKKSESKPAESKQSPAEKAAPPVAKASSAKEADKAPAKKRDDDNVYGLLTKRKTVSGEGAEKKTSSEAKKESAKADDKAGSSKPGSSSKKTADLKSKESSRDSSASQKKAAKVEKELASPEKKVAESRKSSSTADKSESGEESVKKPEAKSVTDSDSDPMDADIAAIDILRPGSATASAASAGPADSQDESMPAEAPGQGGGITVATAVAPAAAPLPPVPNLYLSQPETRQPGGFLSKLFGKKSAAPAAAPVVVPQINFTSDYAARDGDAYCPAILPGAGLNGFDLPIGGEDQYRLTSSLPATFRPTDLVKLPVETCHYGNALYLRSEAAGQLCQMINAAAREGLKIRVVSAYRDYNHQLRLYNSAVARGGENQKMVARPGRSEHFLGTTVDLTNNEKHALARSFGDTPEGKWLAANAHRFGWKMTVMNKSGRRSHDEEPWHLRYLGANINNPTGISPIVQQPAPAQRRDVFGKIGKFLGLRRD